METQSRTLSEEDDPLCTDADLPLAFFSTTSHLLQLCLVHLGTWFKVSAQQPFLLPVVTAFALLRYLMRTRVLAFSLCTLCTSTSPSCLAYTRQTTDTSGLGLTNMCQQNFSTARQDSTQFASILPSARHEELIRKFLGSLDYNKLHRVQAFVPQLGEAARRITRPRPSPPPEPTPPNEYSVCSHSPKIMYGTQPPTYPKPVNYPARISCFS